MTHLELGTINSVPTYWHENKGCEVIKLGACGDQFGYVQNVKTLEVFSTYGYNFLREYGSILVEVTIKG